MSGGIVQLVATGAQDTWLTGKPEVSFYRASYKRYTHYAMSSERQLIQGAPAAGNISTIRFEKKGDLLNYVYFTAKDTTGALIPGVDWSKVIEKIDLLIGGQIVDTQDITWMTQVEPVTGAQNYSQRYLNNDTDGLTNVINGFLPLKFFFCKDWNVSLPLVALQYHDVELRITWNANLNYRVGYETYTTGTPASVPNIGTAQSTTTPINTGAAFNVGISAGTVTVSATNLSQNAALQTVPFTYSGANFQLVPGMLLCANNLGSASTVLGATNLRVLSVTPSSASPTTAGVFYGAFSSPPTGTSLTAQSLQPTDTPYYQTATTFPVGNAAGSLGSAAFITNSASPTQSGTAVVTVTYSTVTQAGQGGYLTVGMTATNIPGCSSSTAIGYVATVTYQGAGSTDAGRVTDFTLNIPGSPTYSPTRPVNSLATDLFFSAPPAGGFATSISSTTDATAVTHTYTIASGSPVYGQIYVGMQVPALPTITTNNQTIVGYISAISASAGVVQSFDVKYNTSVTTALATGVAVTLLAPTSTTVSSAATSQVDTNSTTVTSAVVTAGGYIVPGMSVSGITGASNGTTGTGYVYGINSLVPGSQTSFKIYYPQGAPDSTATFAGQLLYAANSTFSSVQKTVAGQTSISNVPIFGLGANGTNGAIPLTIPVGSILTTGTAKFITAENSANAKTYVVTSITYLTPGVAYATLSFLNTTNNGVAAAGVAAGGNYAVLDTSTTYAPAFTPYYPVVNLFLAAAPTNIAVGNNILGTVSQGNRPIPSVSNIYGAVGGGYIISMKTNSAPATGVATPTVATLNGYYNNALLQFSFVPSNYFVGIVSGNSTPLGGSADFSTGANTTALDNIGQQVLNGASTSIVPPLGTYFYTTASTTTNNGGAAQLPSSPYVASTSSSTQISVSYVGVAGSVTAYLRYSQFALVPQGQIQATISVQPYVDREGSAILSLTNLYSSSSTPLSVGLAVTGTLYTGPVTVSQVISGSVASGTALIEISFPPQSQNVSTAVTGIQFIDPSQPLNPGVTVSTTGFNGTYAQLQYEAWTNFVYLDQAEREFFANTPMDMLITQITRIPIATANMQELALAHPVKFLAFLSTNYTTAYQNQATTLIPASNYYFKTQINGVDVGDSRSLFQWQDVPQYYHTPFGYKAAGSIAPVGLITYCLDTSKLQPTGTLNFSRIDTYRIVAPAGMNLTTISGGNGNYFYAMNYNVLRIKDGMSGLLYSN